MPYNPFKEASQPSGYMEPQPGKAGTQHAGDEAVTRSGRPFDQSRISFASNPQHRENMHVDRARWHARENEPVAAQDRPSVGHKRRATTDARGEAKLRRNDYAAHVQQATKPTEDGELEAQAPSQQASQVFSQEDVCAPTVSMCVHALLKENMAIGRFRGGSI